MTPLILATALSLLALDATPSTTQPTLVAPATVTGQGITDVRNDPDKVICKKEQITGSRFEKRVCMTRSGWDDQARHVEEFERRLGENPTSMGGGGMSGK